MSKKDQNAAPRERDAASETSDQYRNVIAQGGSWRVIRCRDDIQYIVQRRKAGSAIFPWRGCAYVLREMALPATLERLSIAAADLTALLSGVRGIVDHAMRKAEVQ